MSRTSRALVALLSLLALALTACGSGGGGGGAEPERTLRIAYQAFPSGDLIVKNQGWLEEALPGWTVKWTKFDSGASVNQAFIGSAVDIGAIGSSPVARGLSGATPIDYKVAFVLDVAGDNEALVARKDTGITTVEQLRGRTIGTPFASTAHYSLLSALSAAGLTATDVKLVDLQPQAILAAWTRGDIDAAYTWLPTLDELRATGTDVVTSRDVAASGKPTLDLSVISTSFAAENPDVVTAWRKAQARALALIGSDPQAAATHIGKELNISTEEALGQLKQGVYLAPADVASPEWLGTPGAPGKVAENLRSAAEFLAEQKQIDKAADLAFLQQSLYLDGLADDLR